MIRLKPFDKALMSTHEAALKKTTQDKLKKELSKLPTAMQAPNRAPALGKYLQTSIDTILTGSPAQLRKHIRYIKSNFSWFHEYAHANPGVKSLKYDRDLAAMVRAVRSAFDYDSFSRTLSGWGAYELVKAYNLRLCPYCNLNHVNFHYNGRLKKKTPKSLKMRPPLDHYYPRAIYPYLGISLYNLVPSCHQCNSSVKLQDDPLEHFLPHPYKFPLSGIRFTLENIFSYSKPMPIDNIKVRIECNTDAELRHVNFFALSERYGWYVHEIKDMHNRYLSYAGAASILESAIRPGILGFHDQDREKRTLGLCLNDILENLVTFVPK